jgi:hypothetical protein
MPDSVQDAGSPAVTSINKSGGRSTSQVVSVARLTSRLQQSTLLPINESGSAGQCPGQRRTLNWQTSGQTAKTMRDADHQVRRSASHA